MLEVYFPPMNSDTLSWSGHTHLPTYLPGTLCTASFCLVFWCLSLPSPSWPLAPTGFCTVTGRSPSMVTASSEPDQHIQMLLKYFKPEGKTSEGLLIYEQSGTPVQADKLNLLEHKTKRPRSQVFAEQVTQLWPCLRTKNFLSFSLPSLWPQSEVNLHWEI